MPRGPKGEKRPADVIGNAVHVMRVATGEVEERPDPSHGGKNPEAVKRGRLGGVKGGKARALKLAKPRRVEIAKGAAKSRWKTSARSE